MADKKVDRYRPDRAINPTQQTTSALSEKGTVNVADAAHDKGRSALVDKFRRREERWRLEQSLHDREAAVSGPAHHEPGAAEEAAAKGAAEAAGAKGAAGQGGAR
jgi:hypothetical protein